MFYISVNIIILSVAFYVFCSKDLPIHNVLCEYPLSVVSVFILSVAAVHFIKALRLYIALYGNGINTNDYIKTYCKVTPVNIILPFKSGELYRIYCWGYLLNDYLKSTIVVLLDRFMDTIALITLLLILCAFYGTKVTALTYFLILFLLVLFLTYYIFPNFYKFWNAYFLDAKATKNKLWGLKHLEKINMVYLEINNIINGRAVILYSLSILAWTIEIFNLFMLNKLFFHKLPNVTITKYLNAAIGNALSVEFSSFVFISVIILSLIYLLLQIINIFKKRVLIK